MRKVHNPTALMLRVARGPDGLTLTSPQMPAWSASARGPVGIATALQQAFVQLDCDRYAARRGQPSDLALWDAACDGLNSDRAPSALAASGVQLRPEEVTVTWKDTVARRASGAAMRPMSVNGQRHDPAAWTDLGGGLWQSPAGNRYRQESWQVQKVIAARAAADASADELSLFDEQAG